MVSPAKTTFFTGAFKKSTVKNTVKKKSVYFFVTVTELLLGDAPEQAMPFRDCN